jgi:hypothetical protein
MDAFEAEDEDFNNLLQKAKQKMENVRASSIPNYDRHKLELKGANGDIEDAAKCVRQSAFWMYKSLSLLLFGLPASIFFLNQETC